MNARGRVRRAPVALLVALLLGTVAHAEDKKYLSCVKPKQDVFPLVLAALKEKWTIQSVNEGAFLITAGKAEGPPMWGRTQARLPDAAVTVWVEDGTGGGSLVGMEANNDRTGDARNDLLKYLPRGECAELKPKRK